MEQEVLGLVVRDVDVGPAVQVEVTRGDSHGAALELRDARFLAHIRERAVAVVVEQHVGLRLVVQRAGIIVRQHNRRGRWDRISRSVPQTGPGTIAVVIEPRGTDGPAGNLQAGLFRDIRERPVVVVVVENRLAISGHEEVDPAVVVIIRGDGAHAEMSPPRLPAR